MAAILRLFEQGSSTCVFETRVFQASWTRTLSKSAKWTASIPLTQRLYNVLTDRMYAEIWVDDQYGIGSKVQTIDIKYTADPTVQIEGREEIDELYDMEADDTLYIDDKSFILQLFTLLDRGGWRFGEYRDINRTQLITDDLREEKQLLTQIAKLLKQVPELYYRYGGEDYAGQPMLDISLFDFPSVRPILTPPNRTVQDDLFLNSSQTRDDYTKRLYALQVIGGNIQDNTGARRTLTLGDAITAVPARMLDADYPIYEEFSELSYVVVPTVEGGIGGTIQSSPTTLVTFNFAGETGGSNFWSGIIFHPFPGLLTEINFWTGNVTASIETNRLTNPLLWELREVNESALTATNGTLLGSGTVTDWTANSRVKLLMPSIPVSGTKRYMLRLGLQTAPAVGALMQMRVATTNASKTFRVDRADSQGDTTNTLLNYQPLMIAVTTPTHEKYGRRTKETQTRFAPPRAGANATLAEIGAAASAMYLYTVQQLQINSQDLHTLTVDTLGYDFSLRPGDNVEVRAKTTFDTFWEIRKIESIAYTLRDHRLEMTPKFLPNRPDPEAEDPTVALYDEQKATTQKPEGKIIPPILAWELQEMVEVVEHTSANTTLSDGTRGVWVTFTVPPAPAGKGEVRLLGTPFAQHSNVQTQVIVEVVEKPTASAPSTLICKIGIRNAGWSLYDTASVTAHIVWR